MVGIGVPTGAFFGAGGAAGAAAWAGLSSGFGFLSAGNSPSGSGVRSCAGGAVSAFSWSAGLGSGAGDSAFGGAPGFGGGGASSVASTFLRFLLSPRIAFSLLALYGASGNALEHTLHLRPMVTALAAVLPALLVERFAVSPLWNLAFRFQGQPSSSLGALVLEEAKAVTPFRNGRGVVAVVRDGRMVQFSARLVERQSPVQVGVGDRLLVEDVDSGRERLTVSVPDRKL